MCGVEEQRLYWIDNSSESDGPVKALTSIMFDGGNLDVLYVINGEKSREREAGGLFVIYDLGVRGSAQAPFAG